MNNNKGFTLIELLAVITILGIILTISVVAVNQTIKNSQDKAYQTLMDEIWQAYKKCKIEYPDDCPDLSEYPVNSKQIRLSTLVSNGYLSSVTDPKTKEDISNNSYISYEYVTLSGGKKEYYYYVELVNNSGKNFISSEYERKN